jgi:signal transduction histidine kinase/CheY-like chemotaxis protein
MGKYRDSVVETIFRNYVLIYEIDLVENTAKVIWKTQGTWGLPEEAEYMKFMEEFVRERVDAEYVEDLIRIAGIDGLREKLKEEDVYTVPYTVNYGKWRKVEFRVEARDKKGVPTRVLACYRKVEDDSSEAFQNMVELERSKVLLKASMMEAKQAAEAKSAFLSNMSHQIRTPMNAIMGNTQLALAYTESLPDVQEYLKDVMSASRDLVYMMDNLLEITRVESGNTYFSRDKEDLTAILTEIRTMMKPLFEEKGIKFRTELYVTNQLVNCDRSLLIRILRNLLLNALNYTKPGGNVVLTFLQQEKSGGVFQEYNFMVTDDGVGMTEEFLKKATEAFTREADPLVQSVSGAGLGLTITSQLISSLGGKLSIVSKKNVGTKCTVVLDLKLAETEEPKEKKPAGTRRKNVFKAFENKRFLVVGETSESLSEVTDILSYHGASLEAATSGIDAVEMVMRSEPFYYDAVLLDVKMKGLDGMETTKRIRQLEREELSHIPVLLINCDVYGTDRVKAKRVGVDDFVSKPVSELELVRKLKSVML